MIVFMQYKLYQIVLYQLLYLFQHFKLYFIERLMHPKGKM